MSGAAREGGEAAQGPEQDFGTRWGDRIDDRIDDRVAEAFDDYLADRLAEPGPLRDAVTGGRRPVAAIVLGSVALGVAATVITPASSTLGWMWIAIAVINLTVLAQRR